MHKLATTAYWQNLSLNEIKLSATKILPKFVFIILILMLLQTLTELVWRFVAPAPESLPDSIKSQVVSVKESKSNSSLKKVATYHLFGDAKKQAVMPPKVINAPETRLSLKLKGVFASTNTEQALAIISNSKNKDKIYLIGDQVTAGVSLHAVYTDRVILNRNGKLETLRLPKFKVDR